MRIFYYTWDENSKRDMAESLVELGYDVVSCHIPFSDYEEDETFTFQLEKIFAEQKCDIFLSFDFFPLIAKSSERLQKPYISWVYDTPHLTLFSPAVKSPYVKLFVFDREQFLRLGARKSSGLFYQPLAVNAGRLVRLLGEPGEGAPYRNDIGFVGSLYEGNLYRRIRYLPEELRGYLDGIMQAQQRVYGYHFIEELLGEKTAELDRWVKIDLDGRYRIPHAYLYANMLDAEITARERADLLAAAATAAKGKNVTLYSASVLPKEARFDGIRQGGIVGYEEEMPKIFRGTKINLNITLRSITSGIPLRALDIMGAGGFLLSNYQTELAEYFADGVELALFDGVDDMKAKISYYLTHEKERERIARNGFEKVRKEFSYRKQLRQMLALALGEEG